MQEAEAPRGSPEISRAAAASLCSGIGLMRLHRQSCTFGTDFASQGPGIKHQSSPGPTCSPPGALEKDLRQSSRTSPPHRGRRVPAQILSVLLQTHEAAADRHTDRQTGWPTRLWQLLPDLFCPSQTNHLHADRVTMKLTCRGGFLPRGFLIG